MTVLQAAILGIVFGIARMGILYTWPKWSAMFGAMIIGLVMGKLPEAMMMGAALQTIYLGIIMPGGNIPTDETLATFVAIPIALQNNLSPEIAVTLACLLYTSADAYRTRPFICGVDSQCGYD